MNRFSKYCREIYYGMSARALRAQYLFLSLDMVIISYFVVTTFLEPQGWMVTLDMVIGVVLVIDFLCRLSAQRDRGAFLVEPLTMIDFVVIASLFVPALVGNFAFLRLVRSLRLMRSYIIVRQLRRHIRFFANNEDVIFSALNLLVFIFVVTATVYEFQVGINDSINNYVDALYFTITTLTTTGFGDVILVGSTGRLLAVVIMIVGVALFLRLIQTIFRPSKVKYECTDCGLTRHDRDAVHCKHCGKQLQIRTEGLPG